MPALMPIKTAEPQISKTLKDRIDLVSFRLCITDADEADLETDMGAFKDKFEVDEVKKLLTLSNMKIDSGARARIEHLAPDNRGEFANKCAWKAYKYTVGATTVASAGVGALIGGIPTFGIGADFGAAGFGLAGFYYSALYGGPVAALAGAIYGLSAQ